MGQKISPVALRLQTNKSFQASWYSQKLYAEGVHKQLQVQNFLHDVFHQVGTKATKTHVVQTPGALKIHTFFCSPRLFDQKLAKKTMSLKPTHFFQHQKTTQWQFLSNQMHWETLKKKLVFQSLLRNNLQKSTTLHLTNLFEQTRHKTNALKFYANHLEAVSQQYFKTATQWEPVKLQEFTKSAQFVAEYVSHALERQKPVKQIFSGVQTLLKKDPNVEGFKISCSGRLQGVEMAKIETFKFGKISLHVFTSKVDYAEARALTTFGILGVKVWICYKD